MARAETRFGLSGKRTSPFKSAGKSVQLTTDSRDVRISGSNGSNAGYTMFWGRVKDYWLPTPLACFPFTSPPVLHRVPSHFNWALPGILPGGWRRPVRRADNFTIFKSRLSWNLGASTSWNSQGLSRPVMGLFYLFYFNVLKLHEYSSGAFA